jgi:dTDP-4-dehydrorhamnose reductase
MKKILLTGSNGFIGQKIIEAAYRNDEIELIATSFSYQKGLLSDHFVFDYLDITKHVEIERIVNEYEPDTIINTASFSGADYCEEHKEEALLVNVEGLRNLINVSNKNGIHLINFSSDFVFDGLNGPYNEEDPLSPVSWYGTTKAMGEELMANSCKDWTIIRTILVYGIAMYMKHSNLILMIKENLGSRKCMRVVNDQYRMPTFADDLAEVCLKIALGKKTGIYNISGKEMMSIFEIAERVAAYYKLDRSLLTPVSTSELNEKAKRPVKTGFILDKAIRELDYFPTGFDESLKLFDQQLNNYVVPRN